MHCSKKVINPFFCLLLLFITTIPILSLAQTSSDNDQKVSEVFAITEKVLKERLFTTLLSPNDLTGLPIGIVKEVGVTKYIICVNNAVFKPEAAYFDAFMALEFPGTDTKLAFAAKNIGFNPQGIGTSDNSRLELVSTNTISIGPKVNLVLNGNGTSYVNWDCNGFRSVHLKGYFDFDPSLIVPDPEYSTLSRVQAPFEVELTDLHDFIVSVSMTPFCLKGLKDISFSVTNATADMSELHNVSDMNFPFGYSSPDTDNSGTWTGFYIKEFAVFLPRELSKDGKRIEISANNFVIENTGVSGLIQAKNLFSINEGSMNGWPFSINTLSLNFTHNKLNGGGLEGAIQLPIMKDGSGLKYAASVFQNDAINETDYEFRISPEKNIAIPCFAAKMELYPTSSIAVLKNNGKLKGEADLNGLIGVDHRNVALKDIRFEHVLLSTKKPFLKGGVFNYGSGNKDGTQKMAKFPISIDNITLVVNPDAPALSFDATVGFMNKEDKGFSAKGGFTIQAVIKQVSSNNHSTETGNDNPTDSGNTPGKNSSDDDMKNSTSNATSGKGFSTETSSSTIRTKWLFDRVRIHDIEVKVKTEPFQLDGRVSFKDNDPVYGNGFYGHLNFLLNAKIGDDIGMEVNCWFGSKDDFRYWYVDGILTYQIPICSGISIYRLMGGLYYHMSIPNNGKDFANNVHKSAFDKSMSYTPDKNTGIGFKAGVTVATSASEKPMNGDVVLEIAFTDAGGLKFVSLDGTVFFMTSIKDRIGKNPDDFPITAILSAQYNAEQKSFDATMEARIKYKVIEGHGQIGIHFDPKDWFIYVGKPSNRVEVTVINLITLQSYFMVGTKIEPMPAPSGMFEGMGVEQTRDNAALTSGSGFVLGAGIYSSGRYDGKVLGHHVWATYALQAGFDIMLFDYGDAPCSGISPPRGIKGWYATGQFYVGAQAGIGAHYLWKDHDDILAAGFKTLIQGGAPHPTYMAGTVQVWVSVAKIFSGKFDINLKVGQPC